MFEQIWPTLQLLPEEQQLFRRNGRVFVTDLGRSITLQQKYNLAKGDSGVRTSDTSVPYQTSCSLLYESDMHLDALGEHPRCVPCLFLEGRDST